MLFRIHYSETLHHDTLTTSSNEETFLQDFLENLEEMFSRYSMQCYITARTSIYQLAPHYNDNNSIDYHVSITNILDNVHIQSFKCRLHEIGIVL